MTETVASRGDRHDTRRHVGVVTTARADFGCLQGLCRLLEDDPAVRLSLFAGGMHLSPEHGMTIDEIRAAGFSAALVPVPALPRSDAPVAVADAMGRATSAFAAALHRCRPDILVVLGDRHDMLPAPLAALPMNIPVAHIAGGDVTAGQIDDAIRHAVSQLSHLHFPIHPAHGERLQQMGVAPWRIGPAGHPGLDGLQDLPVLSRAACCARLDLDPGRPFLLCTLHPETLAGGADIAVCAETLAGLAGQLPGPGQILFTAPNNDPGSQPVMAAIRALAQTRADCHFHDSLGREAYANAMRHAVAMAGNSSSGILEAATFRLPVVNIGDRQRGRLAPPNVISVPAAPEPIATAFSKATGAAFRKSLEDLANPYGDGHAAPRIATHLKSITLAPPLLRVRCPD